MQSTRSKNILIGFGCVLAFAMLACEPVIAVGWRELLCIFVLMAFLFGPPLFRLIRRIEDSQRQKEK
jgi:hypothetical protein